LKIIKTIKRKILIPFKLIPSSGLSTEKLAFSITIGIISGIFPVIGTTTILSLVLTLLFRQNLLVVQSVQWIMAFIQVLLIIPFMKFGAYLLNQNITFFTIEQLNLAFKQGILSGIKTIGILHLYAILAWFILIIPVAIVSYLFFFTLIQHKTEK
jgi:uncharacterized protein (DUF2062 family)